MSTNNGIHEIERLDAPVTALTSMDFGRLSGAELDEALSVVSIALCRLDLLLSRLTNEIRFRGGTPGGFPWFDVSPADIRRTDVEMGHPDRLRLVG